MVKRPTIADLAAAAGVSIATVDRVLNQRLPVREDTTIRVVEAAEAINYHATSLLRRRLSEAPTRRFGFLLQKRQDAFYNAFGAELIKQTAAATKVRGKAIVDFSDELDPQIIASHLRDLGARCDAVAIVAVDHPLVNGAVDELVARGKAVFTLLSDLTTTSRRSYLAVDSRKAGRTAAWTISRLAKRPGKIGIFLGSHRYLSQEISEISFRSYMREHATDLTLLEPIVNLDDDRIAYDAVVDMIENTSDLAGMYICGGGQDGVIRALRDCRADRKIVTVCNELTVATKLALIDGIIDLVLATPLETISRTVVDLMAESCNTTGRNLPIEILFPAQVFISENI